MLNADLNNEINIDEIKGAIKNSREFKSLKKDFSSYLFASFNDLLPINTAIKYIEIENNISIDFNCLNQDIIYLKKALASQINELTLNALITPVSLKFKYFIIDNIQTISDSAINKLLKTLEEPPSHLKIFILANNENNVKPTIRSRCIILNLDNVDLGKSHEFLLIKESQLQNELELAVKTLLFLKNSSMIANYISSYTVERDNLYNIVCAYELVLHDCKLYLSNCDIRLKSFRSDIIKIANDYNLDALIRLDSVILNAKRRLLLAGNINSIADQLLFSLLATRQKYNFK